MSPTSACAACAAGAVIGSGGWRGYDGQADVGYANYYQVSSGDDEFANDESRINGSWEYHKQAS